MLERYGALIVCGAMLALLSILNLVEIIERGALGATLNLLVTLAVLIAVGVLARKAHRDQPPTDREQG